ncbi:hypothetical protein ABN028_05880 [Actinopolymorpha sp. B17G11]
MIECAHLDEAIEIAAGHPFAAFGAHRGPPSMGVTDLP